MSIKMVKGNLLNSKCEIIAHGVNCSGVAGQIAKKWPRVREAYIDKFNKTGWNLGDIQICFATDDLELPLIVNVATQTKFGYDGKQYANYEAIRTGLDKVFKYADEHNMKVGMPKIGCGLAGGKWEIVFSIIYKLSCKYPKVNIRIYYLEEDK